MVELTDPPVLEHGFVQGRFVTAVADSLDDEDRYPDLRGISGNVRFTATQPVNLVSAGTPATVVQQPVVLPLNADGWLVDAHSKDDPARTPGVWLAVGRYQVQTIFPSATPVPQFSIEVTAEHTKESPLNLTLAAPIILPPRAVEVTRVIDRQLAQEAAGEAQGFRDEAEQFNTWAGENAGYAEGHAQSAAGHASAAETARDDTVALGITVDTSAGTKVSVGGHVVHYDSGLRNLGPSNALFDAIANAEGIDHANSRITLSRNLNIVELSIGFFKTTAPQVSVPITWPSGFVPAEAGQQIAFNSALDMCRVWVTTNTLVFQGGSKPQAFTVLIRFRTNSGTPATLPGTPA